MTARLERGTKALRLSGKARAGLKALLNIMGAGDVQCSKESFLRVELLNVGMKSARLDLVSAIIRRSGPTIGDISLRRATSIRANSSLY